EEKLSKSQQKLLELTHLEENRSKIKREVLAEIQETLSGWPVHKRLLSKEYKYLKCLGDSLDTRGFIGQETWHTRLTPKLDAAAHKLTSSWVKRIGQSEAQVKNEISSLKKEITNLENNIQSGKQSVKLMDGRVKYVEKQIQANELKIKDQKFFEKNPQFAECN